MIVVNIIQSDEAKAIEMSDFLLSNKYALHTHIDVNKIYQDGKVINSIRVFFITKSLLFDVIDAEVRERFYSDDLVIYASPVVHLGKEFGELVRLKLKAV